MCNRFTEASSWEEFVQEFRGPSYLAQDLDDIDHPAAELLRHWRDEGVPAETTSPAWTPEQRDACVERGCHHSANKHSAFLREEMATFMEDKFWMVLPYELVRELVELMLWQIGSAHV